MPSSGAAKKASKSKPTPYDVGLAEEEAELFNPNTIRAADKKKAKNASSKKKDQVNGLDEGDADEVTPALSTSPAPSPSILEQIPYSFSRRNGQDGALDPLPESIKVSDQFSSRTNAWAQEIPFGKSPPGNSIAGDVVGESPPVPAGYLGRGGFNTKTPPRSPAQRKARPVSFGSAIPPVPARPTSEFGYRHSMSNYGSPPALPHLPQQHFYAAQDVNLGIGSQQPKEDSHRTLMAFRELPLSASTSGKGIFVGSRGRLDILAPSTESKYQPIGALTGLSGDVIDAVALTWESGKDPFVDQRPLVAIILHGPTVMPDSEISDNESLATGHHHNESNQLSNYETRVDIYSLKLQSYITTLIRVPCVSFSSLTVGNIDADPAGDLRLDVAGNHVIIASGVSGEIFICGVQQGNTEPKIECVGKFWTTVQAQDQRRDSSHSRSPRAAVNEFGRIDNPVQSAIYSVNGRWLAVCPPGNLHRPSLSAQITRKRRSRASTSIDSHNPPARPSTSCAVESPDVETFLGTLARGAAQQVVKGASWLGNQGLQTWNNYWNSNQQLQQSPIQNPAYLYSPRQQAQAGMFPPTHASETVSREPDVISIIDLRTLSTIATFQPPKSCSFVSFMPNGLSLLTASKKGDVQYIWDLMQIKHVRSAALIAEGTTPETTTPRVRQISKFERLTSSTIVDVIWEPDLGERFALLTKKGTIHLFDLPQSAFRWPPPRRAGKIQPATVSSTAISPTEPSAGGGGFLASAMNIASRAPPMLASLRGRAPSLGQGVAGAGATGVGIASATGVRGGRAVAAGLSKSLGAASGTVQSFRHAGESRLHVDALAANPTRGLIAFGKRGSQTAISILDKGNMRSYYLSKIPIRDKNNRLQMTSVFAKKAMNFKLPQVSTITAASAMMIPRKDLPTEDDTHEILTGYWQSEQPRVARGNSRLSHPLSHAEIESSAPYQPFHSDARVNMFVYSDNFSTSMTESEFPATPVVFHGPNPQPSVRSSATDRWVFGEPISSTRLNIRSSVSPPNDDVGSIIYRDTSATTILQRGEIPDQIVTTTRRKKTRNAGRSVIVTGVSSELPGDGNVDGFFEDDMDVLDFAEDRV